MGKITGFLNIRAKHPRAVRSPSASTTGAKFTRISPLSMFTSGRALHGLRRAVLQFRMPAEQPDSRLERSGLSRLAGATRCWRCTRPIIFPNSPAGSARRRAKRRACWGSTKSRCRSRPSSAPSSITPSRKAGFVRSRARNLPANASRSSARARRDWRPRSSSRAPGHAVTVFEKSDRIGGLLRYGIPDFKMEKRWIDRRMEQMRGEGVEFVTSAACRRVHFGGRFATRFRRGAAGHGRGASARSVRSWPRTEWHPFRDGFSDAAESARCGRRRVDRADSGNRQTRGHSWAAAIPARIAWERRIGRRPRRCTSSKFCRCRRPSATRPRRGRCGRFNCAWKARTKKAASANGRWRLRDFQGTGRSPIV